MDEQNLWEKDDDPALARHRFICELEFIQCLSNPDYLHWLAKERYFSKPEFLLYLRYLTYWGRPEYSVFLLYPQCLTVLRYILTSKAFRRNLSNPDAILELKRQQSCSWIYTDLTPSDFAAFLENMG